jgi:hypothetical protein
MVLAIRPCRGDFTTANGSRTDALIEPSASLSAARQEESLVPARFAQIHLMRRPRAHLS